MRRRAVLLLAPAVALLRPAWAQSADRIYRVAYIAHTAPPSDMAGPDPLNINVRAFVHGLRDLGYIEGRNLILERRSAEGRTERYADIIAELIRGMSKPLSRSAPP